MPNLSDGPMCGWQDTRKEEGVSVVLKVQEAKVQTAHVTIQALKVGTKQVTMGLFRQLPLETLLDTKTLQLQGVPWGYVRYWWEGDGRSYEQSQSNALHLVWQDGDRLCRGMVSESPPQSLRHHWEERERQLMTDIFLLRLPHTAPVDCYNFKNPYHYGLSDEQVWIDNIALKLRLDQGERYAINTYCQWRDSNSPTTGWPELEALLQKRELVGGPELLGEREEALGHWQASVARYQARWARHWQTLNDLPQLFIAV